MTPAEAGVREYCANTRENLAAAITILSVKKAAAGYRITLQNHFSKVANVCGKIH